MKHTLNVNYFLSNWIILFYANILLKKSLSKKQSDNIISGIHALGSLYLSFTHNDKHLQWFSSSYFVYDFIQMAISNKINIMKLAYMIHHLSGIYLLLQDPSEVPIREILFWGELSNLPSYPLYYYLHKNTTLYKNRILFFQIIQQLLYCSIRIPILTQKLIVYLLTINTYKHLFAIIPVYLMGIIWSLKILKQNNGYLLTFIKSNK